MALQAQWLFDETSGTSLADNTGNGNSGTITGYGLLTPGISGNAVWLNGTTGHVEVGNKLNITGTALTVSAWVRRLTPTVNMPIIQRSSAAARQWSFQWNGRGQSNSNKFQLTVNDANTAISSGTVPDDSGWHWLAATWDGSNAKFYVDGVLDSTIALSNTISAVSAAVVRMGTDGPRSTIFSNTELEDVRVYDDVQTGGQLATIYAATAPTYTYPNIAAAVTSPFAPIATLVGLFPSPSQATVRPASGEVWPRDI